MVPATVLECDREDVHDRVVECFSARQGVKFLRIVGAGANHGVGVMAGMNRDPINRRKIVDLGSQVEGQVDQRLCLVLGGVRFGVGLQHLPWRLTRRSQRNLIDRVGTIQHPGDHRILALIDRARRSFPAYRPVDRFDGELAGKSGHICLPARYCPFARLPRRKPKMNRLIESLIDDLGWQSQKRTDPRGGAGDQVGDMVLFVVM